MRRIHGDEFRDAHVRSSEHWSNGGNGIANFSAEELPVYQEAIKRSGDSELFIDEPMEPRLSDYSLRRNHMPVDLHEFWNIWREVKNGVVKNAVACGICRSPADRYVNRFECQTNPGHVGDLAAGIFSDLSPADSTD